MQHPLTKNQTTIGFIGTGVMGKSMASHLLNAGYPLVIYNRTKSKADALIEAGAEWRHTREEVAAVSDVVITMVGYPQDVEDTYLGQEGIIHHARPGSYLIDMTTSKPSLAQKIHEKAASKGIYALDAPVSGGDTGAKKATLSIMVGGDQEAFTAVKPLLDLMGNNVVYQGKAGAGQHTKMCNQIAIASNMLGVCEAIAYAQHADLDLEHVLKSIESGAAGSWSLSHLAPRMMRGDFAPGFYVKHMIKDLGIALEAAEEMRLMTPGLKMAKSLYDQLAAEGDAESGTQALIKLYLNQVNP